MDLWNVSLAEDTLSRAMLSVRKSPFGEIFCELSEKFEIVSEEGQVISARSGFEAGASIRISDQESTIHAFTEDLTEAGCIGLADSLRELSGTQGARAGIPGEANEQQISASRAATPGLLIHIQGWEEQLKRVLIREAEAATAAAKGCEPGIKKVRVKSTVGRRFWLVVNSHGSRAVDQRLYSTVTVQSSVERGGQKQTGTYSLYAPALPPCWDASQSGIEASRRAIRLLESKPVPAGVFPVILAAGAGALLFHEACGHALEADALSRGSVFSGLEGQAIAPSTVTLVDSALVKDGWGSFTFDDEGQPGVETTLIDQGVLRGQMRDLTAARQLTGAVSGNGRRASYRHQPIPRMTNTYLLPGELDPEDLIEATKTGLYACEFKGGQVNPVTGDFSFFVQDGFLIRDGKRAEPVRGATIAGNAGQILKQIDLIANDLAFASASCLKAGQYVPVGLGQPTVRVKDMFVGGAAA
jgi:TldD protein